jgi:DNA mismatch repair ATPase MutS
MTTCSVLFDDPEVHAADQTRKAPACFADLNLDQIVDAVAAGREEYDLKPFFHEPLVAIDAIRYRQEIFRDLEDDVLLEHVKSFARQMRAMRDHLIQRNKRYYKHEKARWFLDAVGVYCEALRGLAGHLEGMELRSRGLRAFRDYAAGLVGATGFASLVEETKTLQADLAAVQYGIRIKESSVTVVHDDSGKDYSAEVELSFEKFKQGTVKDYRVGFSERPEMNHVEAQILDCVAKLFPGLFSRLDEYCAGHAGYMDAAIGVFDREIQFYLAWIDLLARVKRAGLAFCYPQVSDRCKDIRSREGFDLALALRRIHDGAPVVCNDVRLCGPERVVVVTGPNQGGKTTLARTVGQLHYLAALGCPVPGKEAQLFLCDRIFTHFEKEENIQDLRGKLQDDLVRIHDILDRATSSSLIVINEIFTSTTFYDALFLSRKVMDKILQRDSLCVCVTFIDELASLSEKTVSMVSTVDPDNPAVRTFRIVRRPADGRSYALSIAEKYRLTHDRLRERIGS